MKKIILMLVIITASLASNAQGVVCYRYNNVWTPCPSVPNVLSITEEDSLACCRLIGNNYVPSLTAMWSNPSMVIYGTSKFLVIDQTMDTIHANIASLQWNQDVIVQVQPLTTSGIEESSDKALSLYPNPATSVINVEPGSYSIFSISGRTVDTGITNGSIDISSLTPGLYFFRSENKTIKFQKN